MCGILGLIDTSGERSYFSRFEQALHALDHRGPDDRSVLMNPPVALGHVRLSIIDLDPRSNQPMTDTSGRYTLVFNGEIYNFRELREECVREGYSFQTDGDTEVLLVMWMRLGRKCLEKLNGFFAFAVYDREARTINIVRDRFGIKPLFYYFDSHRMAFASEMKALLRLDFPKVIDKVSLFNYFKFNYIPAPNTILESHFKMGPGQLIEVQLDLQEGQGDARADWKMERHTWYEIPYDPDDEKEISASDYKQSQKVLKRFVRESVRRRLIADVPVGTFLSGGIDSSIITAVAKEEKHDIASYSIGFSDSPYYDESRYAAEVARHLGVEHHLIDVRKQDLLEASHQVMHHLDEPFADSSALNVYLLSQYVRQHVKVALSGDGGDELFGGYHKHGAEFKVRYPGIAEHLVGGLKSVWDHFPASRSGKWSNLVRQLQKFGDGYQLSARDRYWRWAGVLNEEQTNYLIKEEMLARTQRLSDDAHTYKKRKDHILRSISKTGSLNEVLLTDMRLVLPNDMLYKVDMMSMAHNLEVRTPFLDPYIVKFAFRLPVMFKVNHQHKKKILQDTYRDQLPAHVFQRPKKGFEVPLLEWFQGPYKGAFDAMVMDRSFFNDTGLLNYQAVVDLQARLHSRNPGDSPATAWAMMVFYQWYNTYMK